MKNFIATIVTVLLMVAVCSVSFALVPGKEAPPIQVNNIKGQQIQLEQYRGRIILIKLATTWCPTCRVQAQEIEKITDFLNDNHVTVLDIFLQESAERVKRYIAGRTTAIQYQALIDDGNVGRGYAVRFIPRTLILDQDLRIIHDGNLLMAEEIKKIISQIE